MISGSCERYVKLNLWAQIHFTGLFLPWHRAFVNDFERELRTECNYKGAQPYWDWTLGQLLLPRCFQPLYMFMFYSIDARPDFFNASIFNDSPTSGFGKWGNPADDYQITTGAFANDFQVAYPVPHKIRRNYTATSTSADPFGDGTPPAPDAFWNYFTRESQAALINSYAGNFEGFQTQLEGPVVS